MSTKIRAARVRALIGAGFLCIALIPPSSMAADSAGHGAYAYDPCVKLTAALVQPFFTAPVTLRQKNEPKAETSAECFFDTADGESEFQVYTATGEVADMFYNDNLKQDGVPSIPVSGVGDKAVREPHDIWIYARKGAVFCMIHGDLHTRSQVRGLQKFADKPVPDDIATRYAQQLGTLCNRLFGSGATTPSFTGLE
ncbi:MAG TPA: hypothetical protein VGI90_18070 [Steroidobacteraceae bacterium]|jgi:hypothetical protein